MRWTDRQSDDACCTVIWFDLIWLNAIWLILLWFDTLCFGDDSFAILERLRSRCSAISLKNIILSTRLVWYGMVWRVNGVLCCVCVMVCCTALYSDLRHFYLLLNSTLHSSTVLYLFYFHMILISSFSSSFLLIFTLFFHFPFIISFFFCCFLFFFLSCLWLFFFLPTYRL